MSTHMLSNVICACQGAHEYGRPFVSVNHFSSPLWMLNVTWD